jgi:hypothetical protein
MGQHRKAAAGSHNALLLEPHVRCAAADVAAQRVLQTIAENGSAAANNVATSNAQSCGFEQC